MEKRTRCVCPDCGHKHYKKKLIIEKNPKFKSICANCGHIHYRNVYFARKCAKCGGKAINMYCFFECCQDYKRFSTTKIKTQKIDYEFRCNIHNKIKKFTIAYMDF